MGERESLAETEERLASEFEALDDWMDRYQLLIETGKKAPGLPPEERVPALKVEGCQSQVWLKSEFDGTHMRFRAASDALITSGLIALLVMLYDGRTPREIVETPFTLAKRIGLETHLSPNRASGFASMVKRIKTEAARRLAAA